MRPRSIVLFERLYLASFAAGLVSTALSWDDRRRMLQESTGSDAYLWLATGSSVLGVVIALVLWFLVARRGSVVAKWIIVALTAWSAVLLAGLIAGWAMGRGDPQVLFVGMLQNLLYVVATVMLFRPDARLWFGEEPAEVEP